MATGLSAFRWNANEVILSVVLIFSVLAFSSFLVKKRKNKQKILAYICVKFYWKGCFLKVFFWKYIFLVNNPKVPYFLKCRFLCVVAFLYRIYFVLSRYFSSNVSKVTRLQHRIMYEAHRYSMNLHLTIPAV